MDRLCSLPSSPSSSSSSSSPSSSSSSGILIHRETADTRFSVVSAMLRKLLYATLACLLALVGSLIGATIGAFIGQTNESGFFRGAAIGAVSGAIFSIEVFESSLLLWRSEESGGSLLYLTNIISSLLSGRLVPELIGPAMLSAVQSQINDARTPFEEVMDIFETGSAKGLSRDSVEKLPKIKITNTNNVDASEERICSVCLQDFQLGETVRSLPHCHHMFHLPCIDNWLVRNGSCPLCRHDM